MSTAPSKCLRILGRNHANIYRSSETETSQKNEGFLKSIWHKLTDKPAEPSSTIKPDSKDGKPNEDPKDAPKDGSSEKKDEKSPK